MDIISAWKGIRRDIEQIIKLEDLCGIIYVGKYSGREDFRLPNAK